MYAVVQEVLCKQPEPPPLRFFAIVVEKRPALETKTPHACCTTACMGGRRCTNNSSV